jgi:LacI family transcriptional regulator
MRKSVKKRVTLSDIAQASGVSLSAVSLALSDKPGISQETRVRVIEIARTMGYPLKIPPEIPPKRSVHTIGLLVSPKVDEEPHISTFYAYIISAIEAACQQMNLNLMYANLLLDRHFRPYNLPPLLEKGDVDGFLIAGVPVNEEISQVLDRRRLPVVLLESYCPTREYSAILYDNFQGTYDATEYLIGKGHRHIGYVGGHLQDYPSFRERRLGYLKALEQHRYAPPYCADFSVYLAQRNEVVEAAVSLVLRNPQITALVCATDDIAIAAISGLSRAGFAVPGDISIIGFDDIEMAENIVPALTTMRVNKQSMGRMAVQILLNHALQETSECVISYFRPTLVERSSVIARHGNPGSQSQG